MEKNCRRREEEDGFRYLEPAEQAEFLRILGE